MNPLRLIFVIPVAIVVGVVLSTVMFVTTFVSCVNLIIVLEQDRGSP